MKGSELLSITAEFADKIRQLEKQLEYQQMHIAELKEMNKYYKEQYNVMFSNLYGKDCPATETLKIIWNKSQ
jgi:phage regulator Rha-like protein